MTTPLPTLAALLRWLTPQPWGRIIGTRLDCRACPLALFFQAHFLAPVTVDETQVCVDRGLGIDVYPMPPGYAEVLFRVDYAGKESREVTVEELLAIVREVRAEEDD